MLRNGTIIMREIMMKRMIYITGVVHAGYMTTISCQGTNGTKLKLIETRVQNLFKFHKFGNFRSDRKEKNMKFHITLIHVLYNSMTYIFLLFMLHILLLNSRVVINHAKFFIWI
jgi:hypothetical protein